MAPPPTTQAAPEPYRSYIEPDADAEFPAEAGRYHLFFSFSCPFAGRALAALKLKGLQDVVGVTVAHPIYQRTRPEDPNDDHYGWKFIDPAKEPSVQDRVGRVYPTEGCTPNTVNDAVFVRDLYEQIDKTPRLFSLPLLWDKKKQTIVSNESADILRTFNSGFRKLVPSDVDLVPAGLEKELDEANEGIVAEVGQAFGKIMFADDESAKAEAKAFARATFDKLDAVLAAKRYLVGDAITEADVRLFHTLFRIDAYLPRDSQAVLTERVNIVGFLRDLYQTHGLKDTINWTLVKIGLVNRNPNAAPAEGPYIDYDAPHGRDKL